MIVLEIKCGLLARKGRRMAPGIKSDASWAQEQKSHLRSEHLLVDKFMDKIMLKNYITVSYAVITAFYESPAQSS